MSQEPLVCRYIFSPKEYSRATQCYWRYSWTKWLFLLLPIPLVMQAYAEFFPDANAPPVTPWSIFLDFLPGTLVLIFVAVLAMNAGQIYFRRSAYCNSEMAYTVYENGINVSSAVSESNLKWPLFARATESIHGFALFHQGKRMFNWLPKSGFVNAEEISRCRELLRAHIPDTKKLFVR